MADEAIYRPRHESPPGDPADAPRKPVVWVPARSAPDATGDQPALDAPHRRRLPGPVIAIGVLLVELAFIASYVGGLHAPAPTDVPVAIVGTSAQASQLGSQLGAGSAAVAVTAEPTRTAAISAITDGTVDGAFDASTGELIVASGRGPALIQVLTPIFAPVAEKAGHASLTTTDIAPLRSSDSRGLVSFYLVVGWIVGGYLLAAVLGLVGGMTPNSVRAAFSRILTVAGYAAVSGIAGTAIVESGFGYASGSFWPLAGLGALLVFSVGVVSVGLEAVVGLIGTALAILLFVVAGNPSAGGPWPVDLSPKPWRQIGPYLPNGAGVTGSRQILFFGNHALTMPLTVLAAYAGVGIVLTLLLVKRGRPLLDLTR